MHATDERAIGPDETPHHARARMRFLGMARRSGELEIAIQLRRTSDDREGAIDRARELVIAQAGDQLDSEGHGDVPRATLMADAMGGFEQAAALFRNRGVPSVARSEVRV